MKQPVMIIIIISQTKKNGSIFHLQLLLYFDTTTDFENSRGLQLGSPPPYTRLPYLTRDRASRLLRQLVASFKNSWDHVINVNICD